MDPTGNGSVRDIATALDPAFWHPDELGEIQSLFQKVNTYALGGPAKDPRSERTRQEIGNFDYFNLQDKLEAKKKELHTLWVKAYSAGTDKRRLEGLRSAIEEIDRRQDYTRRTVGGLYGDRPAEGRDNFGGDKMGAVDPKFGMDTGSMVDPYSPAGRGMVDQIEQIKGERVEAMDPEREKRKPFRFSFVK